MLRRLRQKGLSSLPAPLALYVTIELCKGLHYAHTRLDESGRPLGAAEEISVRSNKVGRIIWVIMGAGVGILFLAIAVRLVRRVRGARA